MRSSAASLIFRLAIIFLVTIGFMSSVLLTPPLVSAHPSSRAMAQTDDTDSDSGIEEDNNPVELPSDEVTTPRVFEFHSFLPSVQSDQQPDQVEATAPLAADTIFADGFETGDLSAWTAQATDGGDLSVSRAVHVGTFGLQATIDDNKSLYLTDDLPAAERRYRTRFYFDSNSIFMAGGNAHYIFYGYSGTSQVVLRVEFRFSGGNYQLRAALINNGTTWTNSTWATITDAPHFIELDWKAATAAGTNDGGLTLWVDGFQRATVTGINNSNRRIDRVRLGAVAGIDGGTRGTYFFDAFESRRQTYIGPAVVTPTLKESFEGDVGSWQVGVDQANGGTVSRSNVRALAGSFSARTATNRAGAVAQLRETLSDASSNHTWGERPGTWLWQRAYVYLPSTTVQSLGSNGYFDLAGFWSQSNGLGWWLRVQAGGALSVYGYDANGTPGQFSIYGTFPLDRWVEVEIGLHSQAGPGVQRAFALLLDGDFYGWYHQGRLPDTDYNRAAIGILRTNTAATLQLFIDQWYATTNDKYPSGTDRRSTSWLQEQDYRTQSGVQWQIDWSTWRNDLRLGAQPGLYSATDRLQSGRNIDRMPHLTNGWAEIEIGWPQGTPPTAPNSYFGPMVGFRKEINREENLEVIPIGVGNGNVDLVLEAWIGSPVILARWPLPTASIGGGSHIPEAGDIIRVRWQQVTLTNIRVWASYYDASAARWYTNIIDRIFDGTQVGASQFGQVNYNDGYHTASSITIDSPYYSIRRFKVGTPATFP